MRYFTLNFITGIYTYYILQRIKQIIELINFLWGGGGGHNPKKIYPSLTFSRVGVGFFWVLLGFFKINNFC